MSKEDLKEAIAANRNPAGAAKTLQDAHSGQLSPRHRGGWAAPIPPPQLFTTVGHEFPAGALQPQGPAEARQSVLQRQLAIHQRGRVLATTAVLLPVLGCGLAMLGHELGSNPWLVAGAYFVGAALGLWAAMMLQILEDGAVEVVDPEEDARTPWHPDSVTFFYTEEQNHG